MQITWLEGLEPARSGEIGFESTKLWCDGRIAMEERGIVIDKYWGLS